MNQTIGFSLHNSWIDNSFVQKIEDYSFWRSLVTKLCGQTTEFEIRCWSDDTYAIETGECFGQSIPNTETQEVVFIGEITAEFTKEISENYLTPSGTLKWFTLNFYNQGELICNCGHYGTEIYWMDVPAEEVASICAWAESFSEISRVDVY